MLRQRLIVFLSKTHPETKSEEIEDYVNTAFDHPLAAYEIFSQMAKTQLSSVLIGASVMNLISDNTFWEGFQVLKDYMPAVSELFEKIMKHQPKESD